MRAAQWVAAFAPAGVPRETVETLHAAFVKAATAPEMKTAFEKGGMAAPQQSSIDDAKAWLRDEMAAWKRDVEETGIVIDE